MLTHEGKGDDRVPSSTLVISWDKELRIAASATTGWVAYGDYEKFEGIHKMTVGRDWSYPQLIHELGHVLGMAHEHQREDRKQSVTTICFSRV